MIIQRVPQREISRLIFRLLRDFSSAAAGKPIRCAAVLVFQSAGEFVRWNPHWHGLFLEGGFDRQGRFVHLPAMDLARMSSCFRQRVIAFFLCRKLLNERLAKSMIQWTHSGFSVDATVRIPAGSSTTRQGLSRYSVRPPLSLQKLLVDEGRDAVVYRAPYSDYFRTDSKIFAPTAFLAEVLQHLPDSRNRLIRCYGLYSPRARGTWWRIPSLLRLAPEGWQRDHAPRPAAHSGQQHDEGCVSAQQSRGAWARLIKKLYEVDPLTCPRCAQPMRVLAVITDPPQVLKVLRHLIKIAKPPPGLDPASLN